MSKEKLILKNGAEVELETGASLGALQVLSADRAAMLATWELLTPDNLSQVQIKNGAGLTVATYTDLVLVSRRPWWPRTVWYLQLIACAIKRTWNGLKSV